jgi:predicted AlkP superfamily phosphohydrolase/phosphomutase
MTTAKQPPLAILLLDTGDLEAIRAWTKAGDLPTLAGLMERGCWGHTGGPEMVCEYGVGLTFFSGISRAKHGYYYFRQLRPGTYELETIDPGKVSAPAFWSHLRGSGRRVFVMDVPDTEPVPGLEGLQLANWGTHHGTSHGQQATAPSSEPPELLGRVRQIFGAQIIVTDTSAGGEEECLQVRQLLLRRVQKRGQLYRELLASDGFDLHVMAFSESDPASHQFWDYRPEAGRIGSGAPHPLRNAIRDVYQAIDREIGAILNQLPADANIVVCSLYGTQGEYPTSTLSESFCRQLGYQVARERRAAPWSQRLLGWARRLLPLSVRRGIGRMLPGASERVLQSDLRDGTDWSRTTAFAIPSLYTSFIFVNLAGRQPQGIVQPGKEYNEVLDRIEGDLRLLIDPHDGRPAIGRIARTATMFGGGPHPSLPDLFVEWQPVPWFRERIVHPRADLVQARPDHCPSNQEKLTGFFLGSGPAFRARGDLGEISLLDLAPTFLTLLGAPIPDSMTGRPLTRLFSGVNGTGTRDQLQ